MEVVLVTMYEDRETLAPGWVRTRQRTRVALLLGRFPGLGHERLLTLAPAVVAERLTPSGHERQRALYVHSPEAGTAQMRSSIERVCSPE
jgi:hypothetical protein